MVMVRLNRRNISIGPSNELYRCTKMTALERITQQAIEQRYGIKARLNKDTGTFQGKGITFSHVGDIETCVFFNCLLIVRDRGQVISSFSVRDPRAIAYIQAVTP